MYLKTIEMYGFKSFANKIVLDFHNGITGIVGPNGSGKSNISDAVRWVLGEQSAKQLRGANMQDVIFSGTENRKPLSYAYVAITMDNSDHLLAIDYEEVTIARRVYRSGESEYLLNGSPCRLRDVHELFYDTGIGKEGYSIIGQGQIERILSGKPEERRELFDEAVGIVKFKKRKAATIKKLENERDNLVRINDILKELERQIGPLEHQAENAKAYLKKKEELKSYDVNAFLLEVEDYTKQLEELQKSFDVSSDQQKEYKAKQEQMKAENERLEVSLSKVDEEIDAIRDEQSNSTILKGKLENQITLLEEQIKYANQTQENFASRKAALEEERDTYVSQKESYDVEFQDLQSLLDEVTGRLNEAQAYRNGLQEDIASYNTTIDANQKERLEILAENATISSDEQRFDTMLEQKNIQKAELNQRLLQQKTTEQEIDAKIASCEEEFDAAVKNRDDLLQKEAEISQEIVSARNDDQKAFEELQNLRSEKNKAESKLEATRNIAERYEGYGNSVRRVMEQKKSHPGIIGVVSDLISVDKKYEVAIETALSGNIQNIVTKDEETAKQMVAFLKENKAGRATFLPLSSVTAKGYTADRKFLSADGVLGLANELVSSDENYQNVISYLLGRVIVVDTIDHGIALSRQSKFSLHIVTLEGEYFSPGGSISGGRFKNNSNLLGRNRELAELKQTIDSLDAQILTSEQNLKDAARAREDLEAKKADLQKEIEHHSILCNTAQIHLDQAQAQKEENATANGSLVEEAAEIERSINEILSGKKEIAAKKEAQTKREQELLAQIEECTKLLDEKMYLEQSAARNLSEIQMEEVSAKEKVNFAKQNCERLEAELAKKEAEIASLIEDATQSKEDAIKKQEDIEKIKETLIASDDTFASLEEKLAQAQKKKDDMNQEYKDFFAKREEVSGQIALLDKEIYRLETSRERLEGLLEQRNTAIWEEYELTLRGAEKYRDPKLTHLSALKKNIASIKDEIRRMGNINVGAIEEYKEVSERYEFLKGQHDDLVEAEQSLVAIIEDLDVGMRKQFEEGFADIQVEFDKAFKELFGGGKGTLELIEGEDILETGIRIIAQPPGKKLQNMMQLSGGEKSLTAIALLFAIQNLKPSPFCLLDEIEAALDDSNVTRFAKYLHKLTKNTQFIIITHRRGTMNAADRLYGITMQEKGVSTLVSVNLIENDLDD